MSFCFGLPAAAAHGAAAFYSFEPERSLTGNCAVSARDEVPDPGLCPGTPGIDHPNKPFFNPTVTTDAYGDIYVASAADTEGRIDIFDSNGLFIGEVGDPAGPRSIAVDSKGNLYVFELIPGGARKVRRFPPIVYEPLKGKIEYGAPVVLVDSETKPVFSLSGTSAVAVDSKDRLYVNRGSSVVLFSSAATGNELLNKEIISGLERSSAIAIDSKHEKIYLSEKIPTSSTVRVFELEAPYAELKADEIDGSTTPEGKFLSGESFIKIDVDDDTGTVFVGDLEAAQKVYEFEEDGTYVATIEHGFNASLFGEVSVDDGPFSPNAGYLYVPSDPVGTGHSFAFEPNIEELPIVEKASVANVSETDAVLHATINPGGLETTYRLEYITQQQFEEEGESFANATVASEGTLPPGAESVAVSAPATGLAPDTAYRFQAFAENSLGNDSAERQFHTLPPPTPPFECPNDPLRIGLSAKLPDCRAYELVTPPNTNGRPPSGVAFSGVYFPTVEASPNGNRVSFLIEGGLIPGYNGAGAFNGDPYLASRGEGGWGTEATGPSGEEEIGPNPGSVSPDQTYSFWSSTQNPAIYIRFPDGHSELVGTGSLGTQNVVEAMLITENGGHIIFQTPVGGGAKQLEENAPPSGTSAVYDRSAEGPTHVVSLLPGNEPQKAGESATYLGASEDGEGIAFSIGGKIYVRLHNSETLEVAGPGSTFAGISEEGGRVFYVQGGDLFAYDSGEEKTIPFSESGDVTPVNVANGGARAYFVSPSVLTAEPNPEGEEAEAGEENLYLSEGQGQFSFVGILTERDVEGESRPDGQVGGLGLWIEALKTPAAPAKDPSRATPAGSTLLFESRADLTGFESEGFVQVYRYDAEEGRLDCLSCSPTGAPPTGDASLQSIAESQPSLVPFSSFAKIANQSPDGQRAFFQSPESLAIGDTDNQLDVYEWEAEGIGTCGQSDGCIYLISGGHSSSPDHLFAMSRNGDDVFFRTADLLLPGDAESTLSIYDARVGGGFVESEAALPCEEGETCHPAPTPAPSIPSFGSSPTPVDPTPKPRPCPKGKHKVKRHGKTECVKKHKKKRHHRSAGSRREAGAK